VHLPFNFHAFSHSLISFILVSDNGKCYTFGSNNFGQLGHKVHEDRLPAKVAALESEVLSRIACGDTFTVAISAGKFWNYILV
jgi:NIMA (never in mitosis gene a)-related kinase